MQFADPPSCNVCGNESFVPVGKRGNQICRSCGSDGRTRLLWLILTTRQMLHPGLRCLHIAPEAALAGRIGAILGNGYEPVDIDPDRFPFAPNIHKLDLVADAAALPSGTYDLILHSHVMEHIRGNVTAVLFHLHRALKPSGKQVCCIPIMHSRHYAEDLGPLLAEDAAARFGQDDHVRIFGEKDLQQTLGMVFALPERYDLLAEFDRAVLTRHVIPEVVWSGWSASAILVLGKDDLLLTS